MLTPISCAQCGATFTTSRPTMRRTCGDACRSARYRVARDARREAALDEVTRLLFAHGDLIRASISSGVEPDRPELDDLARRMDEASDRAAALLGRR